MRHDSFADLLSLDPLQVRDGGLLVPVSQQDYDYKMEQKEPYTAGCNAAWFSWLWSPTDKVPIVRTSAAWWP